MKTRMLCLLLLAASLGGAHDLQSAMLNSPWGEDRSVDPRLMERVWEMATAVGEQDAARLISERAARLSGRIYEDVAVGPGCQYENLQDPLTDIANGAYIRRIYVSADYQFSQPYLLPSEVFENWLEPSIHGGIPGCHLDGGGVTYTTLDAGGNGRHFMMEYQAGESDPPRQIEIRNFRLQGGNADGGGFGSMGGAILLMGRPGRLSLRLVNTRVSGNQAGISGGGILVMTNGDPIVDTPGEEIEPLLFIDDHSQLVDNEADERGGAIACINPWSIVGGVTFRTGASLISGNSAQRGGGLSSMGCSATIRAGGPTDDGVPTAGIVGNHADYGGGIHADSGAVVVVSAAADAVYGGDPDNAAIIRDNEAVHGAGIYAQDDDTLVFLLQAVIADNTVLADDGDGGHGGGILATLGSGVAFLELPGEGPCRDGWSQGSLVHEPPCNRMDGNHAEGSGGAAAARNGAAIALNNVYLTGNTASGAPGGSVARAYNDEAYGDLPEARVTLSNALLAGNSGADHVLLAESGGQVRVGWSTLSHNTFTPIGGSVLHARADAGRLATVSVAGSIVWGTQTWGLASTSGAGSTSVSAHCVIGYMDAASSGLSPVNYYSHVDPEFRDTAAGDFHLQSGSPAINYCDEYNDPPEWDLDYRSRGQSHGHPPSPAPGAQPGGTYDLGAFVAFVDELFSDRFEQ